MSEIGADDITQAGRMAMTVLATILAERQPDRARSVSVTASKEQVMAAGDDPRVLVMTFQPSVGLSAHLATPEYIAGLADRMGVEATNLGDVHPQVPASPDERTRALGMIRSVRPSADR